MNTLSRLGLALLLCAAPPALAQVPATAGAPTDRPMAPEPGQRTGTDRTLDQSETDLPQANIRTRSEREEAEARSVQGQAAPQPQATRPAQADRPAAARQNQPMMMSPTRAQYDSANRVAYERMVQDRFTAYDAGLERYRTQSMSATGNDRAERARQLIQLRRQRDQLNRSYYRLRRTEGREFDTMRRSYTDELTRYDAMLSEMDGMNTQSR